MTVEQFARDVRARRISAAEATDACLKRIEADSARLNAFILVMADEARRDARQADAEIASGRDRGPLHGVPISVKDLFDVAGTVTTAASRVRDGLVAAHDAAAIAALRRAGAVIIGKTNLHEFAFGTTNEESAYGAARNPHDPSRSPGGSSGGSAISVATGMALASMGTDTGASIRVPAALCGVVGLKPTYGELPTDGVIPLSPTCDHVGPITQTVSDAWHLFHALRGDTVVKPLTASAPASLHLAVPRAYFCDLLDHDVRRLFEASLAALRAAGATVTEVAIPSAALTVPVYMHITFGDAAAYHAATLETMPEKYTKPVRLRLEMARYVLAEDYVRALAGRERLRQEVDAALAGYDALVLPTLPIPAPPIGATTVAAGDSQQPVRAMMLRLTQLFNLTGHPAISIPNGTTPGGLPSGLQLVGTRGQTGTLLHVALAVETVLR
jgi:aspartyl-tRNA(Asn)/glutamyl-tRNA(Gln) amidotransferase subunit A